MVVLLAFGIAICALLLRLLVLVRSRGVPMRCSKARTMVVLGSGGHTAEMLMLVDQLDKEFYSPRMYVVAETDRLSGRRALDREAGKDAAEHVTVVTIPRSREVGQSYLTSVGTTLYSLLFALKMVAVFKPQLVLVNGPGTCIPICASAYLLRLASVTGTGFALHVTWANQGNRFLGVSDSRIVYVESIARVRKLSLSGRILHLSRMADLLFVQWPALQDMLPRCVCAGRLY